MSRIIMIFGLKKWIWTFVLAAILVPLLVASYRIPVQDVAGQTDGRLTYISEGEGFSFSYPQDWLLRTEKNYAAKEISETVTFVADDGLAHGFFQVIRMSVPIADYIAAAKEDLTPGYDSLSITQKAVGDRQGYVLSYKRGRGDARRAVTEFYFVQGSKLFRFSCFYPEKNAALYTDVFEVMLGSFSLQE